MKPNTELLYLAVSQMAKAMCLKPLPKEDFKALMAHVLYKQEWHDVAGKDGWCGYSDGLITAEELRDLTMAHCSTKIAHHNHVHELDSRTYVTSSICEAFELALFGSS